MKANQVRCRIAGSKENCERILSLLKGEAKTWGKRKLFKARKFKRDPNSNPYHRTFGNAPFVVYVDMMIKPEKSELDREREFLREQERKSPFTFGEG